MCGLETQPKVQCIYDKSDCSVHMWISSHGIRYFCNKARRGAVAEWFTCRLLDL